MAYELSHVRNKILGSKATSRKEGSQFEKNCSRYGTVTKI